MGPTEHDRVARRRSEPSSASQCAVRRAGGVGGLGRGWPGQTGMSAGQVWPGPAYCTLAKPHSCLMTRKGDADEPGVHAVLVDHFCYVRSAAAARSGTLIDRSRRRGLCSACRSASFQYALVAEYFAPARAATGSWLEVSASRVGRSHGCGSELHRVCQFLPLRVCHLGIASQPRLGRTRRRDEVASTMVPRAARVPLFQRAAIASKMPLVSPCCSSQRKRRRAPRAPLCRPITPC